MTELGFEAPPRTDGTLLLLPAGSACSRSSFLEVKRVIVVTNRIPVAKGHESDFEDRFRRRAHLVDRAPGFIRNEVHRPRPMKFDHTQGEFVPDATQQAYYEVKTWWRSFQDFEDWTRSPAFAEAHKSRPPKEMFAGPNSLDVHEVFIESPASGNLV